MSYTLRKSPAQRYSGLAVVIGLHVAVVYLLASGLGKSMVQVISGPIETKVIEEVQTKPDEPPPPPPKLETPPPEFVPPPEIIIAAESAPANSTAITQVQNKVVAPPPPPKVEVTAPRSDPRRPNSQPPYPTVSKRLGEEGVVTLQLYVTENGRVAEAKVQKSSGFPRLDEAAVREARRNWRFIPAKRGGEIIAAWMSINVRFEIKR